MMGIAEPMQTVVELEIGDKMVMDGPTGKSGQDTEGPQGDLAAFGVNAIVRQLRRAGDMEPLTFAGDAQSSFVKVDHRGGH